MKYVIGFLVILPVLFILGSVADDMRSEEGRRMYSRDIGCSACEGRGQKICRDLSNEMDWEWFGHAIIAPGWRVTFDGAKQVYCQDKITLQDAPALKDMIAYKPFKRVDWRLENGVNYLLTLLRNSPEGMAAKLPEGSFDYSTDSASIFNPQNPNYILRGGCEAVLKNSRQAQ